MDGLYYITPSTRGAHGSHGSGENRTEHDATRSGIPIYAGEITGIEDWKFKIMTRYKACTVDPLGDNDGTAATASKQKELGGKLAEGLRDDALRVAMDMGPDELATPEGPLTLIKRMEEMVRPYRKECAKKLWKEGSVTTGQMARQNGEPMTGYIAP
jgi:hypothetical protein